MSRGLGSRGVEHVDRVHGPEAQPVAVFVEPSDGLAETAETAGVRDGEREDETFAFETEAVLVRANRASLIWQLLNQEGLSAIVQPAQDRSMGRFRRPS